MAREYAARVEHLLLVEFAATNRFHRANEYPYFLGLARAEGLGSRWLRYGVPAGVRFEQGDEGIGLEPAELERLTTAARELGATRVLFNRPPSAAVARALVEAVPGARVAVQAEGVAVSDATLPAPLERLSMGESAWRDFVGIAGREGAPRHPLPDFGYEPANEAAATMQPLPFLVLGEECTYNRAFSKNPFFAGLDLGEAMRTGGCAFCTRPPAPPAGKRAQTDDDDIRRQLERLRETLPEHPGRLAVRMVGEPAFRRVEQAAAVVRELGLSDTDFLLDARADELVRRELSLRAALEALADTRNRLHIALVGIESFVREELDRFNKGTDPTVNLEATRVLLELERDFPERFAFREHGGLSLILMTPWTTVEDVLCNLRVVEACKLEPLSGKVFSSRLRLHEGLPLTLRAAADGLLVERYDDPALDTAARNLYGVEKPWRFVDPRMEGLCALLVRFPSDTGLAEDALAVRLGVALREGRSRGRRLLEVALELAEAARAGVADAGSLLESLEAPAPAVDRANAEVDGLRKEVWVDAPGDGVPIEHLEVLVALSESGLKPVTKMEPVSVAHLSAWRACANLPNLTTRRRAPEVYEVFFGADAARVDEVVRLTEVEEGGAPPEEVVRASRRVGELLGYPACCTRAFADEPWTARSEWSWLHVERRLSAPTAVAVEHNPFSGFHDPFVPCGLYCEATVAYVQAFERAVAEKLGEEQVERARTSARHPWLMVVAGQSNAVELIPESDVGERFRYRAGKVVRDVADLEIIRTADELVLEPERVWLLCRGTRVADLTARAFLWWYQDVFQAPWWNALTSVRRLGPLDRQATGAAPPQARELATASLGSFGRKLGAVLEEIPASEGLAIGAPLPQAGERVTVLVRDGSTMLTFAAEPATEGGRWWFRIGPMAFSHPGEAAPSVEQKRLAARFREAVADVMQRRAGRRR